MRRPGSAFHPIQAVNSTAWIHTKVMLPQKRATNSATRSASVRLATASSSSRRIACTFSRVTSATVRGRR